MRHKAGTCLIVLGTLLVAAALCLFFHNRYEDLRAQEEADAVLSELIDAVDADTMVNPYDTEMTEVEIDGIAYIGYLSIPALDRYLPVISSWSYPYLRISPCRYTGSTKSGDLVLCAHNYASHFGTIKNLSAGDDVYFYDMDGRIWHYTVSEVTVLQPTAIEEMTDSGYDLTLFTCTYGGQTRVTVRCTRVQE